MGVVHELLQLVPARLLVGGARQPGLDAVEADIAVAVTACASLIHGSQPQNVHAGLGVEIDEIVGLLEATADGGHVDAQLHHDGGIQPGRGHELPVLVGGGQHRLVSALVGEEGAVVDLVGGVGVGIVTRHVHQEVPLGASQVLGDEGLDGAGHGHGAAGLDLDIPRSLVHGQRPGKALAGGVGNRDHLARGGLGQVGVGAELGIHHPIHVGDILGVALLHSGGDGQGIFGLTLGDDGQGSLGFHGHFLRLGHRGGGGSLGRCLGGLGGRRLGGGGGVLGGGVGGGIIHHAGAKGQGQQADEEQE